MKRGTGARQNAYTLHCVGEGLPCLRTFGLSALQSQEADHELEIIATAVVGFAKQQVVGHRSRTDHVSSLCGFVHCPSPTIMI